MIRCVLLVGMLVLLAVAVCVYEAWASLHGGEITLTHLTRNLSSACLLFPVTVGVFLGYLLHAVKREEKP